MNVMKRIGRNYRRGHSADERGATFVLTAVCMVALLGAGALGVDVGFSVVGSRNAQVMADTAALDLARYLDIADAGGASQANAQLYIDGKKAQILTDNGSGATLTATVGKWLNGVWSVPASCAPGTPPVPLGCNAIKITAAQSVPQIFYGGFNTLKARSTIAANTPEAGFSIGSFLANANTQNVAQIAGLNYILGSVGTANLTLVGYQGVATSYVTLNQLISADSTVLSPTNILSASMTPAAWLSVLKTALGTQIVGVDCSSSTAPGACEAYNSVLGQMLTFSGNQQIQLCQLFWFNPSTFPPTGNSCSNTSVSSTGLNASLNVMQMLTTTAEIANGQNAINLAGALNITGITTANVTLSVIQPPAVAYGPVGKKATTAQINASLSISALGLSLLGIQLNGATGTATLSNINCTNNVMQQTNINASTTAASGSVTLAGTNIAGISVNGGSSGLVFAGTNVPPNASTLSNGLNPVLVGSQSPSLSYSGLSILSPAYAILNGALQTALPSVLSTLGVTIAGADVADLSTELWRRIARPVSAPLTLLGGAAIGMAAGLLLVPFTRRALTVSVARASDGGSVRLVHDAPPQRMRHASRPATWCCSPWSRACCRPMCCTRWAGRSSRSHRSCSWLAWSNSATAT